MKWWRAAYGAFTGPPSQAELERFFFLDDTDRERVRKRRVAHTQLGFAVQLGTVRFLDDTDRERVRKRRVAHTQLGFAVQLGTVRFLGLFLEEPIQVPPLVVDYIAGQLGIADPSVLTAYPTGPQTAFEHAWEIAEAYAYRSFADVETDLAWWVDARAWTTGDGPPGPVRRRGRLV